jgi:hypothetical protein
VPGVHQRIVALLVERIDIGLEGLTVRLRVDGISGLTAEKLASVRETA